MSMRASAIQSWMLALSAIGLPKGPGPGHGGTEFEGSLRPCRCTHAVVDPSRAEPGLTDRETLTLTLEQVLDRDTYVVELDFGVALAVLIAEHRHSANDGDSGGVDGDDLIECCR